MHRGSGRPNRDCRCRPVQTRDIAEAGAAAPSEPGPQQGQRSVRTGQDTSSHVSAGAAGGRIGAAAVSGRRPGRCGAGCRGALRVLLCRAPRRRLRHAARPQVQPSPIAVQIRVRIGSGYTNICLSGGSPAACRARSQEAFDTTTRRLTVLSSSMIVRADIVPQDCVSRGAATGRGGAAAVGRAVAGGAAGGARPAGRAAAARFRCATPFSTHNRRSKHTQEHPRPQLAVRRGGTRRFTGLAAAARVMNHTQPSGGLATQ